MYYLVEELTSGLVEGYYTKLSDAVSFATRHQSMMPDCRFTITEHNHSSKISESELLVCAPWFNKRRGGNVCYN